MRFGFSDCHPPKTTTPPMLSWCHLHQGLTVTLQPLPCQAPEESATVLTEGGALVVVDLEAVGHVNLEPLLVELQDKSQPENPLLIPTSASRGKPNVYHRSWFVYCPLVLGYDCQAETVYQAHKPKF